jgi:hypothetical protein
VFERTRDIVRAVRGFRVASRAYYERVESMPKGRLIDPSIAERTRIADAMRRLPVELDPDRVAILKRAYEAAPAGKESGVALQAKLVVGAGRREEIPAVEVLLDDICVGRLAVPGAEHVVMLTRASLDGATYYTTATLFAEPTERPPYKLEVLTPRVNR